MKYPLLIGILLSVSLGSNAQKAKVISAYNYLRYYNQDQSAKDLVNAKDNIDAAAMHEQSMNMAKTWFYRGKIYYEIARSQDENIKKLHEDPTTVAYEAFKKAQAFNDKKLDKNDIEQSLKIISAMSFQQGVNIYNDKNYPRSLMLFERSIEINKGFGMTDSLAIYNAALSSDNSEKYEKALGYYQQCIDLNYGGAKVFSNMADLYKKQDNEAKILETIKIGRVKYPDNQNLITMEINIFLKNDNADEALASLNDAIRNDPENSTFYYARGTIYNKKKQNDLAVADYNKAIEMKPDYFDALYNLGALYFNTGAELINESNSLPLNKVKEADELKGKAMENFKLAQPILEKAHGLVPEDKATMQSLKSIYARTKQTDKYNEMKAKLEN